MWVAAHYSIVGSFLPGSSYSLRDLQPKLVQNVSFREMQSVELFSRSVFG